MKIQGVKVSNLKIVPEYIMIECAGRFGPEENNSFKECIEQATVFKQAGLTPIYLCTNSFKKMFVTTKEKLRKEYH